MLTLRYTKEDSAVFISHIDLLKQFVKIINRSKIAVEYSKGFHPHMQMFLTTPLPVGVSSEAEYITIFCNESSIIDKLNKYTIGGIKFTKEYLVQANPKLTAKIDGASYKVSANLSDSDVKNIEDFLASDSIVIENEKDGEITKKEVKQLIYDYKVLNDGITISLACGNPNLRIDHLIKKIRSETGVNLLVTNSRKISQYIQGKENVEDYLERLKV